MPPAKVEPWTAGFSAARRRTETVTRFMVLWAVLASYPAWAQSGSSRRRSRTDLFPSGRRYTRSAPNRAYGNGVYQDRVMPPNRDLQQGSIIEPLFGYSR